MKTHLSDILPRLKKYSQSLDQTAMLVDKPWVVNAGNNEYQKLIFKRDGTVLLSRNGNLIDGKWEYIPGANALVIDYGSNKILYRHSYLDEAVLALQKDGAFSSRDENSLFLLANENEIPSGNGEKYLLDRYFSDEGLISYQLNDGRQLIIKSLGGGSVGADISEISEVKSDGQYLSDCNKRKYIISNGILSAVSKKIYLSDTAYTWSQFSVPQKGDLVYTGRSGSHTGVFKLNDLEIFVKNKTIVKVKDKEMVKLGWVLGLFILFIIAVIVYAIIVNS
jgi:hypothetical protein